MEFFDFFSKIGNVLFLSFLWLVGCIPVVTAGASTTAYCVMLRRLITNKEGYMFTGFLKAFKENFVSSTKVWLIYILALLVVAFDYYVVIGFTKQYGGIYDAMVPIYVLMLYLLWAMAIYMFPYMAGFEDTTKNIIKNSFLISTRHFIYTIFIMLIDGVVLFVGLFKFAGVLLLAPALIGVANVAILNHVMKRYENPDRYKM